MTRVRRALFARGPGTAAAQPAAAHHSPGVTRLEGFSDAVFAFALTLLVVALEVPKSFDELLATMRGFVAFGLCFAALITIWKTHYDFFRRYPLTDSIAVTLNALLLFVVLFYVYPLKFLFSLLIGLWLGLSPGPEELHLTAEQGPQLMMIYGAGFLMISLVFVLLGAHAWRLREGLGLDAGGRIELRGFIQQNALGAGIALLSIAISAALGPRMYGLAGWVYFLIAPAYGLNGAIMGRAARLAREATDRAAH